MSKKLIYLLSFISVLGLSTSVATGAEFFQEIDGLVVMEGENFTGADGRNDENGSEWRVASYISGFVGSGYVEIPPPKGTNGAWENSCELTYEIRFTTAWKYNIWLRRYSEGGGSDSCWVGLDGTQMGTNDSAGDHGQWIWKNLGTMSITAGLHVFNLRRREAQYKVDRILLTTDSTYTPTGDGPPESPRGIPVKASNPSPADEETDVPRDVVLSWTLGIYADKHDVYFGTNFNDVNDADRTNPLDMLVIQNQVPNSYSPAEVLQFGQIYYWRIDEVNAPPDYTLYKGDVWQFTVEPFAYPIAGENITPTASSSNTANEGPENTINGSGLDANDLHSAENRDMWFSSIIGPQPTWIQYEFDRVYKLHQMWVWNHNSLIELALGFGVKDATIEYSTDGANWTTLGTTYEFARAPGAAGYAPNTTVDLGGMVAKYVKITANSNWGGILQQYSLSEVRFFYIPLRAREPSPDSVATDVDLDVVLSWRAGREAAEHDVYLSTDEQAVIDGTAPVTVVTEANHSPSSLDLGTTYYWRVEEVNDVATPAKWEGDVWNFTTREYLVVDDFESYNDLDPDDPESNRIFNAWIDGYEVPANGSLVGYENPPFCERTIVHGGKQSMPLAYDNTGVAAYSEAELTLSPSQDWTKAGVATLALWFHGSAGSAVTEQMYVKLNGVKVVYPGGAADIAEPRWKQWNIDLTALGISLSSVTELSIGFERTGASGGTGTVFIDDILLYRLAPEIVVPYGRDLDRGRGGRHDYRTHEDL